MLITLVKKTQRKKTEIKNVVKGEAFRKLQKKAKKSRC